MAFGYEFCAQRGKLNKALMRKGLIILTFLLSTFHLYGQIDQQAVDDFARNFSYRNRIHIDEVREILSQAKYDQSIIDKMNRPAEGMPWHRYRNIFMKDERINAGVEFWKENEEVLEEQ